MMFFFIFNDTAPTEIYPLSLHDALPIWARTTPARPGPPAITRPARWPSAAGGGPAGRVRLADSRHPHVDDTDDQDRKSTRLNSSHANISYAVFCLKKKIILPL